MSLNWTLAARYLGRRKLRTALPTLAVTFGVLAPFGPNAILPAITEAFRANLVAAAGQVDLTITHRIGSNFPLALLESVQAVEGVSAASGSLNRTVNLPADFFDRNPARPDQVAEVAPGPQAFFPAMFHIQTRWWGWGRIQVCHPGAAVTS